MPVARPRSLALAGTTSTITSPCTRPSRFIAVVVKALSAIFCAVPADSLVDPRSTSAPTTTSIATVASRASGEPFVFTTATTSTSRVRAGVGDSQRVRRAATGRHRDEHIAGHQREFGQMPRRLLGVVLVPVGSRCAAGDPRDHAPIGQPECAGQFGRLGERYPPGRSGSDEDQAAAAVHPVGDQFGAAHDVRRGRPNDRHHALLGVEQQGDDLVGGQLIQVWTGRCAVGHGVGTSSSAAAASRPGAIPLVRTRGTPGGKSSAGQPTSTITES